ncbi:hypothetical protein BGW80DRAFT_1286835 [Lactifluus volemus]|nr:hypothetical protein BGW80DRAFT_1286835 [Lactifluus volemus]
MSLLAGLLGLGGFLAPALGVGISCLTLISGTQCANTAVCCNNFQQNGVINLGCSPVDTNL